MSDHCHRLFLLLVEVWRVEKYKVDHIVQGGSIWQQIFGRLSSHTIWIQLCLSGRDLSRTSIQNAYNVHCTNIQRLGLLLQHGCSGEVREVRWTLLLDLCLGGKNLEHLIDYSLEERQFNPSFSHPKTDRKPSFPRQGLKPHNYKPYTWKIRLQLWRL